MQDEGRHHLLSDVHRVPIEQCVSAHLDRAWQVVDYEDMADYASHPAVILSDGVHSVFVKMGKGELAQDQFEKEIYGLSLLAEHAGVLTPTVIGEIEFDGGALLVMEAANVVEREGTHWRDMGRALARIHNVKGEYFGLETHCYWGSLFQDNSQHIEWSEFFWQRRLAPRLKAAVDSGNLPLDRVAEVEKLRGFLPQLCGPEVQPSLLHGDAQQNNFLSTVDEPVLIDPSVYYGHPEMDLAYVDFFAPVNDELFNGYRELAPIDPGFDGRRDLWLIPAWLAMVQVEGPGYLDGLIAALGRYV